MQRKKNAEWKWTLRNQPRTSLLHSAARPELTNFGQACSAREDVVAEWSRNGRFRFHTDSGPALADRAGRCCRTCGHRTFADG